MRRILRRRRSIRHPENRNLQEVTLIILREIIPAEIIRVVAEVPHSQSRMKETEILEIPEAEAQRIRVLVIRARDLKERVRKNRENNLLFQRDNKSNENITGLPEGSPFRIIGGNMELVSVIVPVYNVEKYLKKCVDSILSQSYQNIEVILINDGSLDGSGEICEAYVKKDERIKYITQNNSGLGKTRNRGVEEASGKYLLFVDSDDYIENTMIEKLYHNITESHADVASCGVYNVYRQKCIPLCEKEEKFLCDVEKAFGLLLVGEKIPGSSCNKLYRSELLDKVKFPEGVLYEDVKFHLDLMQIIQSVHVDTTPLYYYVHREESITTKKFDSSAMSFI